MFCTEPRLESSRDLSLGLDTSRDPFLQVLVSVLVLNLGVLVLVLVLKPQSLGLGLGLRTPESRSRSWSWYLGTMETRFSSLMKREIETNRK